MLNILDPFKDWTMESEGAPDGMFGPPRGLTRLEMVYGIIKRGLDKGYIVKSSCQKCGSSDGVVGHHESYLLPFAIVWLCFECHKPIGPAWRYDDRHTSQCAPVVSVILYFAVKNITNIEKLISPGWSPRNPYHAKFHHRH